MPNKSLTTPANKGNEAMAYLTYIIDFYHSLPSIIVFLHPHESGFLSAWHTDTPLHSNVDALNALQLSYVQKNGYVNLRCNHNPGCLEKHWQNKHITNDSWVEFFGHKSEKPKHIAAPCCAQFAVSRNKVLERTLEEYKRYCEWLLRTEETNRVAGQIFEYSWHMIFGKNPV